MYDLYISIETATNYCEKILYSLESLQKIVERLRKENKELREYIDDPEGKGKYYD